MFIVGLTGGIGSGKSAATEKFLSLDINIVDADIASRTVVKKGRSALAQIEEHFGKDILTNEGTLDRSKLRKIILSDLKEKRWLESLLHPKIGEQINKELAESSSPYTVFVAPLLLETNSHLKCSRILVVDVPMEIQIERTILRDKVSEDHVKRIIAAQMNREERLKKADDVLLNSGTIQELEDKLVKFHKKYLKMSKL
tara:strand:+ start:576 stop:1172 length:597 start_codon:yes stop_codon:yes gene_type:complete